MKVEQFTRKSFPVEGVQVTANNMEEVAGWCDGDIRTEDGVRYIKVRVHNPINERQTKAFASDWVLYAGKGYKVYKDSAFRKSFSDNEMVAENRNAFDQETYSAPPIAASSTNPGGTHTL